MAEAVVGSLLFKIGSALVIGPVKSTCSILTSEASAMHNFFDEMEGIKAELESIRGFLHEAERFSETAANIKNFIREIRTVAFDIEDIVDEFTYELNEHNRGVVAKTIKRVTHVKTWYKLTKILRKRKSQLGEIQKRKNEYDTSGIVKRGETQEGGRWRTAEYEHFKMEGDLTGIDENKKKLMMLSDEESENHVISVWGMGGVGKTTLVTHVYKTVKKSFGGCAWLTVSQIWERDQLLRKMLKALHREDPNGINIDGIETKDFLSLVQIIQNYLQVKRYLLIVDDVWTPDVWRLIRGILPEGTAARIILTTRNQDVALLAPEQQIMKINPLGKHHSWDLFCKTAFKKNNTNTCPQELSMWARKIVEKCDGLPLAILAIGGVMACKEQTEREWKRMWEDLEHELAHNPNIEHVNRILELSFADLSSNLKKCLLYCAIYPEDTYINTIYLTELWIAEGFVETSERRTHEEVAEDYLSELVSRCLLQVLTRDGVERVQRCTLHNIIHSMVVSKSMEEEFFVVHRSSTHSPRGRVRRMSIQNCNLDSASNNEYSLRSIFTFGDKISLNSLTIMLRSSKLLRVLNLHGTSIEKLPEEVCNLFNLHYLRLSDTGIKELPKSIGRLQNLQILCAVGAKIKELPNELTKLQRLRVLVVYSDPIHITGGVMPPKKIWKLKNLRTLGVIKATDEIVRNFETLTKLTRLGISQIRSEHCEVLFTAISKFSLLEGLLVQAKDGDVLQLQALNTSASEIEFTGQVERTSVPLFSWSLQHHNSIKRLELNNSGLDENSFSCLQEIRSLRFLVLTCYEGNELCFHEMSFLMLRKLKMKKAPHLERIEINKGAMPNLEKLYISYCPQPKDLPRGMEYLSKLELFEWVDPGETLLERFQREVAGEQVSEDRMRILRLIRFT